MRFTRSFRSGLYATARFYSAPSYHLFSLWKTGPRCTRLSINASFKLLKDGRKIGGDRAHPVVSKDIFDECSIIHPFVDCFVDEVRVRALIDSGSMKSFISQSACTATN